MCGCVSGQTWVSGPSGEYTLRLVASLCFTCGFGLEELCILLTVCCKHKSIYSKSMISLGSCKRGLNKQTKHGRFKKGIIKVHSNLG